MYYGNEKNNFDYKWIVIKIKILYNNNRKEKNVVDFYTKTDFSQNSELNNYVRELCEIK